MQHDNILPSDGNSEFIIDYGKTLLTQMRGWTSGEILQVESAPGYENTELNNDIEIGKEKERVIGMNVSKLIQAVKDIKKIKK